VPFRDFGDPEAGLLDFDEHLLDADATVQEGAIDAAMDAFDKVPALGGGDQAEDILGALDRAAHLRWKAAGKFVVLIHDAPGHGELFAGSPLPAAADRHSGPHPKGLTLDGVMGLLRSPGLDANLLHVPVKGRLPSSRGLS
jgi:hypothetical protein